MSRIEVVSQKVLFTNRFPGHRVVNSYLPFVEELSERELICVHRRGTAFYSPDGGLGQVRSTDGGETWNDEGLICESSTEGRVFRYSAPFLSRLGDGSLVLAAMRAEYTRPDQLFVNAETGAFLPVEIVLFQSTDNGHHWSAPHPVQLPDGVIAYLAGPVVELNGGVWLLPFDAGKAYDDPTPLKAEMLGLFSRDRGQNWGELIRFADGSSQNKAHWHGRVIRLLDGKLFTLLWTKNLETGEFLRLHRTSSDETGRHWAVPEPTDLPGETSWAVDLGDGRMFAAYTTRQGRPPAIRGAVSDDNGESWDLGQEMVVWDASGRETIGVASTDTYPASHDVIAFGRPQATRAANGDVLVSFWCTEASITHLRWCRLRVR